MGLRYRNYILMFMKRVFHLQVGVVTFYNSFSLSQINIPHKKVSFDGFPIKILVQWLKLPASKVGDRGFVPRSGIQVSKKQNVSSPLTRNDSTLWEPP